MEDCFSPWKKPSDVMKLRRKKRRMENKKLADSKRIKLLDERNPYEIVDEKSFSSDFEFRSIDSPLFRSKNPFRRNSLENSDLVSLENNDEKLKTKHALLDALDHQDSLNNNNQSTTTSLQNSQRKLRKHLSATYKRHNEKKPFDISEEAEKSFSLETSTPSSELEAYNGLPVDWSLKQKIRLISVHSFNWCKHLKTSEEADGVYSFLQNPLTQLEQIKMEQTEADKWKSSFQRECLYWIHPNLPWMKMFPRIQNERSLQNLPLCDRIYDSLQDDWSSSFHSAFGQLKSGHCPYFYFCTHQLSVLFRRISRTASLSAIVTPTTRGIREALTAEGIQYKMPFDCRTFEKSLNRDEETSPRSTQNSSFSQESSTSPNENDLDGETDLFDDDESSLFKADSQSDDKMSLQCSNSINPGKEEEAKCDEDEENDDGFAAADGAAVWLESIGLDKKNFPSLDPRKVKLNRDGFKKIDSRPESTIVLETDIDVNALFNFLLNWKSCFAAAGPQFRIPPTILSPSGFKGAVLKSMKVKHSEVFLPEENQKGHVLEIVGPLLPCHVRGFVKLFWQTQAKQFSIALNTHESTSPFNVPVDFSKNADSLNFDGDEAPSFLDFKALRSITQVKCMPSGFTWS